MTLFLGPRENSRKHRGSRENSKSTENRVRMIDLKNLSNKNLGLGRTQDKTDPGRAPPGCGATALGCPPSPGLRPSSPHRSLDTIKAITTRVSG